MRITTAKLCLALIFTFIFTAGNLYAQDENSVEGDFIALQALYNSTQGQGVPKLSSTSELPTNTQDAEYPYMYMINGEIYHLQHERLKQFQESSEAIWVNAGAPWPDKTGWTNMTPATMGDALGIETDASGRVISIDMWRINLRNNGARNPGYYGNNLVGELPAEINNLHKLQYFAIKQNFFHGEIPDINNWTEVAQLSFAGQDQYLILDDRSQWHESDHWSGTAEPGVGKKIVTTNRFRTSIPASINGFQDLEMIELRHQFLTGSAPAWNDLPSIKGIFIDSPKYAGLNSIGGGSIPKSWGNLTTTVFFMIGGLGFTGDFPQSINDNWEQLANISLGGHQFSGPIPEFLKSRDKRYVYLNGNNFTGGFPSGYFNGDNSELNKFQISNNNLTGEIPEMVSDPNDPGYADALIKAPVYPIARPNYRVAAPGIGHNDFTGILPEWIQTLRGLQTWYIVGNSFEGTFPVSVAEQDRLKTFYIRENNFSGVLPPVNWGNRKNPWIYIDGNNFEGEIPDSWISIFQDDAGNWYDQLSRVHMADNNLSGRIPDWALNVSWVYGFDISQNRYTFVDIGPVYDALKAHMGDKFKVDKQKPFGKKQNRTMPAGSDVILDLSKYDYTNNSYQWLKDGIPINGENGPILTITNISDKDEGRYVLEVTNSDLSELGTHQSQPINFQIGEDDGGDSSNNNDSQQGDDTGSVFPNAPIQHSPLYDAESVSLTAQFEWSDVGADFYVLHVSRSNPNSMVFEVVVEDTTFTPSEILDDKAKYQWRVHGVKDGEVGDWSPIWTFSTEEANIPKISELISPENQANGVNTSPGLEWKSVDADYYKVRLKESDSSEWRLIEKSPSTFYQVPLQLEKNSEYTWQIKAVLNGVEGAWGPIWSFSTGSDRSLETALSQNYPNPFNPSTQIEFTLDEAQNVSLKVYDMAGREVANLIDELLSAGSHSILFNAGHLSSGIYFYRYVTKNQSYTKKMTLLK